MAAAAAAAANSCSSRAFRVRRTRTPCLTRTKHTLNSSSTGSTSCTGARSCGRTKLPAQNTSQTGALPAAAAAFSSSPALFVPSVDQPPGTPSKAKIFRARCITRPPILIIALQFYWNSAEFALGRRLRTLICAYRINLFVMLCSAACLQRPQQHRPSCNGRSGGGRG
jgi:hypothetical protein